MSERPVPLIELVPNENSPGERFRLNEDCLRQIDSLDRLLQTKVAVISVAGAFRKGKSFLLNFFLRYLRALEKGDTDGWIRSQDTLSDGFHWRSGTDRDTTGILIWSKPFFIRKSNGEEVAVLLMDTQGTFDHQSTQQDCTTIFAFSTLLSSVQIFNISQNIQETDLQYLRLFVEFAAMASDSPEKVLQHLWFLIRDWQFSDEIPFGVSGGEAYLRKVFLCDASRPQENQELREGIKKFFLRTSCCLLPYPGSSVTRQLFNGELEKLDLEFVRELERFVPRILSPENLAAKSINGIAQTGQDLFNSTMVYFEAFRSGKLPSPVTILSATVEMTNMAVANTCRETFDRQVQSRVDPSTEMSDDQLNQTLESVMHDVLTQFDQKCMQRCSPATVECKRKLIDDLRAQFQQHRLMNRLRSDKIAADQKSRMLHDEVQSLQSENLASIGRMRKMEEEFQQKLKQISESSVSKEEMASTLERESLKHRLAMQEVEAKSSQMASKIEAMSEKNAALLQQMQENQEEQKRQERLWQEKMEEWKRKRDEEDRKLKESRTGFHVFMEYLIPAIAAEAAKAIVPSLINSAASTEKSESRSRNSGSTAQLGNSPSGASISPTAATRPLSPREGPSQTASFAAVTSPHPSTPGFSARQPRGFGMPRPELPAFHRGSQQSPDFRAHQFGAVQPRGFGMPRPELPMSHPGSHQLPAFLAHGQTGQTTFPQQMLAQSDKCKQQ